MNRYLAPLFLFAFSLLLAACGGSNSPAALQAAMHVSKQGGGRQVDVSAYYPLVQQVYVAYFGRPADPGGLQYFASQLASAGAPASLGPLVREYGSNPGVKAVLDVFSSSQESQALYAGDNDAFLMAVYRYLFNRQPDAGGKAFWLGLLNTGVMTRANAALEIMASAQDSDIAIVDKKAAIASNFTNALATELDKVSYSGLPANVVVRAMLGNVDQDTDPNAFRSNIAATIEQLVVAHANSVLLANAGADQSAVTGAAIVLKGSARAQAAGDAPLSYSWTLTSSPAGSIAALRTPGTLEAGLTPDVAGTYVAKLVVSNGMLSSSASVTVVAAQAPAQEKTVVLRVVGTDQNWGQERVPGWPNASPVKDADGYSLYDLEIAKRDTWYTNRMTLYKLSGWNIAKYGDPPDVFATWWQQSTLLSVPIASDGNAEQRSVLLLAALKAAVDTVMAREKPTRVVISYSGHGAPNIFFEGAVTIADAKSFLQHVRAKAPGATLVLDFSTNCNVAYFDFAVNVHALADYLIASEKPVGGFDIVDVKAWLKVQHDANLHQFFQTSNSTVTAIEAVLAARRAVWDVNAASISQLKLEQSLAAHNLKEFSALMSALAARKSFDAGQLEGDADLGAYIYGSGDPALIAAFERFRFAYASNRTMVTWSSDAYGFSVMSPAALKAYLSSL